MTHTVILNPTTRLGDPNPASVHDAILWCDQEFGHDSYDIESQFPSWQWVFKFNNPQDATHFALKWIQ
jgi:hypothetical protein